MEMRDLKPYDKNPRKITEPMFNLLGESLEEYGDLSGIVFNVRNNQLVSGHQRTQHFKRNIEKANLVVTERHTADKQGTVATGYIIFNDNKYAYREVDWDEKKHELAVVRANKIHGDFDWDILANQFEMDDLLESGFTEEELSGPMKFEPEEEDDEVPEAPANPISKLGDIYDLGNHRIMCGDSIQDMDILMGSSKAGMVFTDPPYNVAYVGKTKDKMVIENDEFKGEEFYDFLSNAIAAFKPYAMGDVYIAMSSSELHTLFRAFTENGGHWSTFIIWVKNCFTIGRSNYQRQYEPILYGWFEGTSHYWSGTRKLGDVYKDRIEIDSDGVPLVRVQSCEIESDIWDFDKPSRNKEHPTMKPVDLVVRAVSNSSKVKDIVLDPFLGSGSTLIACEKTGRRCYGMELDPKYVDVIIARWEKYTGQKAVKIN